MTDTQEIIPLTVTCCWSFDPVTAFIWRQLKETVLEDKIFTEEEISLVEKIMFNVKEYGTILENALSKGVIDKSQMNQLENARNKIWVEAHNIALRSDGLSDEVQKIFAVLKKIMIQLDTNTVFRI
ncbi:MAG: hypothetical protein ACW98F_18635 [Candidatus Hodarchaeales archaeon]|jgi:hypothetical protein